VKVITFITLLLYNFGRYDIIILYIWQAVALMQYENIIKDTPNSPVLVIRTINKTIFNCKYDMNKLVNTYNILFYWFN